MLLEISGIGSGCSAKVSKGLLVRVSGMRASGSAGRHGLVGAGDNTPAGPSPASDWVGGEDAIAGEGSDIICKGRWMAEDSLDSECLIKDPFSPAGLGAPIRVCASSMVGSGCDISAGEGAALVDFFRDAVALVLGRGAVLCLFLGG